MRIIRTLTEWNEARQQIPSTTSLGLVTTMGNLHQGHALLLKRAKHENDIVVLTIFVNRTQFNQAEDYQRYPRTIDADCEIAQSIGVDYVILPTYEELYSDHYTYKITESIVSQQMEGIVRPGHFDGVLTVVMKLLNMVRAQRVYFGEKDYQQLLLVRGMVKAFLMDIEVVGCETVREASGLPMSSRNNLLSSEEKKHAELFPKIFHSDISCERITEELIGAGFGVDYVEEHYGRRFAAVTLGKIRLIDNIIKN